MELTCLFGPPAENKDKPKNNNNNNKKRCVVYTKDDERQKISMLSMCKLPWLMSCPMLRKI